MFNDDELKEINVRRCPNKKLPFKKMNYKRPSNGNGNKSNGNGSNNGNDSCRYCKKKGHKQRECKSQQLFYWE